MHFPEGSGQGVLDEIVCGDGIACQNPRIARQTGDQGLDFLAQVLSGMQVLSGRSLSRLTGPPFRRATATAVFRSNRGSVQIRNVRHRFCSLKLRHKGQFNRMTPERLVCNLIAFTGRMLLTVVNPSKFK